MLQQTQVETVIPYHRRWMARFPDVGAVASATEEAVLKAWEGLGYYARARNLHKAARLIEERYHGRLPEEEEALQALPGVGAYTAGAIASIGYNRPAPVVDGNVGRVLGRLLALDVPARSSQGQARLWATAHTLVPQNGEAPCTPRNFNQGLMELGALICRPNAPQCVSCPVRGMCDALRVGDPEGFPPAPAARTRPLRVGVLVVAERNGRLLVRKRLPRGVWGGLWELPWDERAPGETPHQAAHRVLAGLGMEDVGVLRPLGALKHVLTHFALALDCFAAEIADQEAAGGETSRNGRENGEDLPGDGPTAMPLRWASQMELARLPLARLSHKAIKLATGSRRPSATE